MLRSPQGATITCGIQTPQKLARKVALTAATPYNLAQFEKSTP